MPIQPRLEPDVFVALLRALRLREPIPEADLCRRLREDGELHPGEVIAAARRFELLVASYPGGYKRNAEPHFRLAERLPASKPVPHFHEFFADRAQKSPFPAPPKPSPAPAPASADLAFAPLWGNEATPHRLAGTRVEYFRAKRGAAGEGIALVLDRALTLAEVHQRLVRPMSRLAWLTTVAAATAQNPELAAVYLPRLPGYHDAVVVDRVAPAELEAVRSAGMAVFQFQAPTLPLAHARRLLRTDPFLQEPLLLLYALPGTDLLTAVVELPYNGQSAASSRAEYLEYFEQHYRGKGLLCLYGAADSAPGQPVLVYHDPEAFLRADLAPVPQTVDTPPNG
ncbi:hypothetical protein LJY25_03445 [Hymenobacter sp. BT175]|uniref:hypothetical protein n=1 Tax=Hymenobacter translucens TaxID=2886507 RepID=UPI001D0E34B9|nr:hypothetical protein [Hymenobacter translucens]MCC2545485.1 hypothetical protein [Hymenobacter translucens]